MLDRSQVPAAKSPKVSGLLKMSRMWGNLTEGTPYGRPACLEKSRRGGGSADSVRKASLARGECAGGAGTSCPAALTTTSSNATAAASNPRLRMPLIAVHAALPRGSLNPT